jgi:hypothetical protein
VFGPYKEVVGPTFPTSPHDVQFLVVIITTILQLQGMATSRGFYLLPLVFDKKPPQK